MAWYAAVKRRFPARRTASASPATTDRATTATAKSVVFHRAVRKF